MHDNDVTRHEALEREVDQAPAQLARRLGLNRRQFLGASMGVGAAVSLVPLVPSMAAAAGTAVPGELVIPRGRRGIILYSVRDAVSRDPKTSPLPSGFKEVFKELARIGYKEIEFAGFNQSANAPGGATLGTPEGAKTLRRWLDDNGLSAQGSHGSIPSTISPESIAAFDTYCQIATILGMPNIGTGSDPTSSPHKADWIAAADRWNFYGARAARHGLRLYTHNHDAAYSFLLDSGPTNELGQYTATSGKRRLEYFLELTDPKTVFLEMDIFWAHVAKFKFGSYVAADGSTVEDPFDPLSVVKAQPKRFPLFHAKDGDSRPDLPNGYEMTPFGLGDIDYRTFLSGTGGGSFGHPMWEQDTAPSAENPAQSLQFAELSYDRMATLVKP